MKSKRTLIQQPRFTKSLVALIMIALIFLGYFIIFSRAADVRPSIEPEVATLSGSASVGNDAAASGGKYIQFNTATTPPPTPPPPTSNGFPDETNTGVPAGTNLRPTSGRRITTPGVVIDGELITGELRIAANNVTVRNSKVVFGGTTSTIVVEGGTIGTLIEDVTIDGLGTVASAIYGSNWTGRRLNIFNVVDGPRMESNTTLEDSYIHGIVYHPGVAGEDGDHNDGIQVFAGVGAISGVTIRRNNIHNNVGNRVILMGDGPVSNVLIENNLLHMDVIDAVKYGIIIQITPTASSNIVVRNNQFWKGNLNPAYIYPGSSGTYSGNIDYISKASI